MPRILLLLPTDSYRASDFVDAAGRLGLDLVAASERRQALAGAMGDRALVVDFDQPELAADRIEALHQRMPIHAVVAPDDRGVLLAAMAAERLGLPGNPPAAVAATRDKRALRRAWAAAGVTQPRFVVVEADDDVGVAAGEVGLPCVVKPLHLSGSRGVIRADSREEALQAARRTRAIAGDDGATLLIESFLPGAEVALEGLLDAGHFRVLAVFDKPDPLEGPFFEETIYVTPSSHPPAVLDDLARTVAAAVAALGLVHGPVHAELRLSGPTGGPPGPSMLEVGARPIGGHCSRALRFGLMGTSLEEVLLRHAVGLPTAGLRRETDAAGVMMLPIPGAGTLTAVEGQDEALAVPGIAGLEITVPRGRTVLPLPEGDRYLGFLFARGSSPADVEAALRAAQGRLRISVDPVAQKGSAIGPEDRHSRR